MTSFLRLLYSGQLLLGALLVGFLSQRAQAQPTAAATGCRVVSHRAVPTSSTDFFLEQCILTADGHTQRPLMAIPKGFMLEAAATSGFRNLYLLRKTGADTVQLLLTDSLGRVRRQPRLFLPRVTRGATTVIRPTLFGLPAGQGFVLTYPLGMLSSFELHVCRLGPDLAVRWRQTLVPAVSAFVRQISVSDTHLWIMLEQSSSVTGFSHFFSCNLATGAIDGYTRLAVQDEVEAATVVPEGLLVLGNSDRKHAPPIPVGQPEPKSIRRDFALLLGPDGQKKRYTSLSWPTPGRPLFHWKSASALPDGSYQLIGETYRETVNGGTVALALLGGGTLGAVGYGLIPTGGYINQRPTGLVVAHLNATSQLGTVHQLRVPEALHTATSDSTTDLPKGRPIDFRFRGLSTNQSFVVLNTTRQILVYSLANNQLQPLTEARSTTPTVLAIEAGQITVGWTVKPGDILPEVERLALP